jgi:PHD/YefM family antitoxin component YafN of YafNO toxin-antitoxin module
VGNPVGVILPLEEFALVEDTLNQRLPVSGMADKLIQMEQAANEALFMNDLQETMSSFDGADAQFWEPVQ